MPIVKSYKSTSARRRYARDHVAIAAAIRAAMIESKRTKYYRASKSAGMMGVELKFVDHNVAGTALATSTTGAELDSVSNVNCLNACAQGDSEQERDGRKCIMKSLHIRGRLALDAAAGATVASGRIVRILVVHDKQTNGAQFNSEDVLTGTGDPVTSHRNLRFTNRFRVLKDQIFHLNTQAAAGNGTANDSAAFLQYFKWNFKLNIPTIYSNTTAVVASITDHSLHVIALADAAGVTMLYESRVRFVG